MGVLEVGEEVAALDLVHRGGRVTLGRGPFVHEHVAGEGTGDAQETLGLAIASLDAQDEHGRAGVERRAIGAHVAIRRSSTIATKSSAR